MPENQVFGQAVGVHGYSPVPKRDFIMASYEPFGKNRYIDITSVLNDL